MGNFRLAEMKTILWRGGGGGGQGGGEGVVGGRGGSTNYKILSATMVGRRRKFLMSNRLKRLEKLNICRRQVM